MALVVAGPLAALPLSFVFEPGAFGDDRRRRCSARRCARAWCWRSGSGRGRWLLGGSLAALVSFYDFPGRRWLDWALVLPLAMPAYVLVFVLLGQYDEASPLQSALRALLGDGFQLPQVRSTVGTITVLTLVLYPYVYILGRGAFLEQSRDTMEAARTLGMSHARAVVRVALPLARPALAAGAALAVMEALADFGAVNLLNYRAMTDAIYRVWYGAFDQAAALQLATILLSLTLALVALERLLRGRARYHGALARGEAVVPRRLHGARAALAAARCRRCCWLLVLVGPVVQLVVWAVAVGGGGRGARATCVRDALTSLALAGLAALLAAAAATVDRLRPPHAPVADRRGRRRGSARSATRCRAPSWRSRSTRRWRGWTGGSSTAAASCSASTSGCCSRARSSAWSWPTSCASWRSRSSRSTRACAGVDPALDDAARSLGADANRVLADVHLPLLWPGIVTAALLVFVEVMKELPATALLRPLGGDTLAVAVWEATRDSRFEVAALPALLIVAVGLVPVVLAIRYSRGDAGALIGPSAEDA